MPPARNLARALARDGALDHALSLTRVRALAADRALAAAHELDTVLAASRALELARALDRSLAFTRAIARDLARDLASDLASDLDLDAGCGITTADDLAKRGAAGDVKPVLERPAVRVTVPAVRVAAAAAWLLPPAERVRYSEEYRSELWDLAADGASRLHQTGCALRQFRCAVPLRFAVLSPLRRRATP